MNTLENRQSRCLAGVARCDITPPVGIYHRMWGAATHDRATGIHRSLTATVLYLHPLSKNDDHCQVIIAVDHCLMWTAELNWLLDSVSKNSGVARNCFIIFFSHTHGAGLMGLERQEMPGGELIEQYLHDLASKISSLVVDARIQATPTTIVYGYGRCGLATHRDYYDVERGHYVCGFNPLGEVDDTLLVGRVIREDSRQTIATIINYACHPTTLAWDNTLISPDFPGAMREIVETATHAPCLFIQGASGDTGPREGFVGDTEIADRNGRQLGYAVLATLESLPPAGQEFTYVGPVISGATIGTWVYRNESPTRLLSHAEWNSSTTIVPLRYRADLPIASDLQNELKKWNLEEQESLNAKDDEKSRHARAMLERTRRGLSRVEHLPQGDSFPYPLIAWRIGDAVWIALDGEHYNILQRTLRARFSKIPLMIGTLANGSKTWYLPNSESYGLGLYQEQVSILAKGALETIIESATESIRQLLISEFSM